MVSNEVKQELEKQGYRIVGNHSAIKICTWCKHSLNGEGICYKGDFYGIKSWRCVQMSCSLTNCSNQCVYCWRDLKYTNPEEIKQDEIDDPKFIVDGCIREQREILQGFKGSSIANMDRVKGAMTPLHFALSLTGDSFFYPKLGELIKEIHSRGMSTFLVTNGQLPEKIKLLQEQDSLPTQFYLSLDAPTKELYRELDRPIFKDYWERLNRSLEIMKQLDTRTVIRLTVVKGLNDNHIKEYAELIKKADPDFVEVKAYMFIGKSRQRLKHENMPAHNEIIEFSKELAKELAWKVIDEKKESRVALIAKEDYDWRKLKFDTF